MSISFANLFRNHEDCELETVELKYILPKWLQGTFTFTGYGVFDFGNDFTVNYYNDGYAILGKFILESDKVSYQKKLLQSAAFLKAKKAGKTVLPEYGTRSSTDLTKGYFSRLTSLIPETSDNSNHGIFNFGKDICISNGQCYFQSIHSDNLEIKKKFDAKKLFGVQTFSAHPHVDRDGNVYNIGVESGATGSYQVIMRFPIDDLTKDFKNCKILTRIPSSIPMRFSSCPSIGVTENYLIVVENNACLNLSKVFNFAFTGKHYSIMELVEWMPDFKNQFHVIEKSSGRIIRCNKLVSDVGFLYLHFVNCYEDNREIVVDLVTLPNLNYVYGATLENLRKDVPICDTRDQGAIQRFRIPLETLLEVDGSKNPTSSEITLKAETLSERGIAAVFPSHKYEARSYRYCYGIGYVTRGIYANSITKFDFGTNNHIKWTEKHCFPNSVTFVADPDGQDEDDGILICGICDTRKESKDFLMFLNAKDMTEICRIRFTNRLPIYFHGVFNPSTELNS